MAPRRRLDAELVRRQLVGSRTEAQSLIGEHRVLVNGSVADKASRQVSPADAVIVDAPPARFVGRGGEKLEHALSVFTVDVRGLRALDAGASTGGFTDCLLQRGAAQVVALDVGHGQLHERLRADPPASDRSVGQSGLSRLARLRVRPDPVHRPRRLGGAEAGVRLAMPRSP